MLLSHILSGRDDLAVVDTACDGLEAVDKSQSVHPDVVLMDINMPRLDGLGATEQIMARNPVPIVVMSATTQADTHGATFQALEAGALAFVPKPRSVTSSDFASICKHLTTTLIETASITVNTHRLPAGSEQHVSIPASLLRDKEVFAVGLSTGGPPVLRDLLAGMDEPPGIPMLVAQHLSPGFEASLAAWLQPARGPRVVVAENGMTPSAGTCYLAPGGMNMIIRLDGNLQLLPAPSDTLEAPSIHELFSSVQEVYGNRAIAALMTGQGRDGADALLQLREAGALTIVQHEAGCTVNELPAAAQQLGAARTALTPAAIARTLCRCG
jgi:two-component system chemotaxis response regulator CheB